MRRKSMAVAIILWFFLGFLAAHKFYLGKSREGFSLIVSYFFVPLFVLVVAILVAQSMGIQIVPPGARPEDAVRLLQEPGFLFLTVLVLIVLAGIWVWDLNVLIRQVRAHNQRVEWERPRQT